MDVIVPSPYWTPPARIDLTAGATLKIDPGLGLDRCIVRGMVWIPPAARAAKIDPSVGLVRPAGVSKGVGVVQCAASDAVIEPWMVDLGGVPQQGVQVIGNVNNVTVRNSMIHNNMLDPTDNPGGTPVGYLHAVYVEGGTGHHIYNLWLRDIRSGCGLHFTPAPYDNTDVHNITIERCYYGIALWGPKVSGNKMSKIALLSIGAKGSLVIGGGTSQTKADIDYVETPTPGYGYVAEASAPDVVAARAALLLAQSNLASATNAVKAGSAHVAAARKALGG